MRARLVIGAAMMAAGVVATPAAARRAPVDAQPTLSVDAAQAAIERLRVPDLRGTVWTPERLRGRVVLIDFWATWCAPCLSELPRLKELREQYRRGEFEILGVMLDAASRRTTVSWLNRNRIDWPQIHERAGYDGNIATAFGVRQLPATVLLDHSGTVVAVGLRGEALRRRIEQLIDAGTSVRRDTRS